MTKAPRFKAYLRKHEGRSILEMDRSAWDKLNISSTEQVYLDIRDTPIASIAQTTALIVCTAQRVRRGLPTVNIYRHDPEDEPTPINKDIYFVIEDIAQRDDFADIVRAASTRDDPNLRQYLSERVYLVKKDKGPDHWLPELPNDVKVFISST